jgi:4-amino-4-deoxy-L-arabinose transferase-like glycosyltransferase
VWPAVAFLCGAGILITGVAFYYLLPAMAAASDADDKGRKSLAAHSTLLLAVILVILLCMLVMTFRVGRWFLPRKTEPRTRTKYVDAWAESARRMETPEK